MTQTLSPREQEILKLIASGQTSRQIGERLGISSTTVDTHRHQLHRVFRSTSTITLIRSALKSGVLSSKDIAR